MSFDFPSSPTVGQQYSPVAGTTYTWNGVGWTLAQSTIATVAQIKTITASGTYVPAAGLVSAIVECVGGGGGGGSVVGFSGQTHGGGGGGSGGYSRKLLTAAQIGASQTITVGAAGAGSVSATVPGGNGGDTSFGALCIAKGGIGGGSNNAGTPFPVAGGAGGSTTGAVGDVVAAGSPGGSGSYSNATLGPLGQGGSGSFGGGAVSATANNSAGNPAGNYGSGGSGGFTYNTAVGASGGNGSAGVCIVTEFIAVSAVPAPGFPVQIARVDVSSAVAQVDFTSGIDGTYDQYELHFYGVVHAATGNLSLRISQDGGATWKAGASDYTYQNVFIPNPAANAAFVAASATAMVLGLHNAAVANGAAGVVKFFLPISTTQKKPFLSEMCVVTANFASYRGSGFYVTDNNAINALRIFNDGGNISSGTFILYGIKK